MASMTAGSLLAVARHDTAHDTAAFAMCMRVSFTSSAPSTALCNPMQTATLSFYQFWGLWWTQKRASKRT